jgi:hypothetical protein
VIVAWVGVGGADEGVGRLGGTDDALGAIAGLAGDDCAFAVDGTVWAGAAMGCDFVGGATVAIRAGGEPVVYRFVLVHLSHQSPTDSYQSLKFCGSS